MNLNVLEQANLIQMTIIYTTASKNPQKKWSSPHSQQESLECSVWLLSHFRLFATQRAVACQVPLSWGFSRQEYRSCHFHAVLEHSLKNDRMISARFQGKPFSITVNKIYYALSTNAKEVEAERFYEEFLELTKKKCIFHHRGLEYKRRKSRDTWSNRQVWPWSTICSTINTNRALPRECTGHLSSAQKR